MAKDPNSLIQEFKDITKEAEIFLKCDETLQKTIKRNLKNSYDFSKSQEIVDRYPNALHELFVEKFDVEQIWQQIELQNDLLLSSSLRTVSKLLVNKEKLLFTNLEKQLLVRNNEFGDEDDSDASQLPLEGDKEIIDSSDDDHNGFDLRDIDDEEDDDELIQPSNLDSKRKSIVDDEFFKLEEMENFLENEERKMNDPDSGNNSEESEEDLEDEGSINFFEKGPENEDDARTAKFKDFFVANEDTKKPKKNKFLANMSDEDGESPAKSSLELRQERLQKKIDSLEQKAVSEKPWTLKGEISADSRPQNSLLEEIVEFDMTSRPAPVITENTSVQLEDIIRQRIKDKTFDSVERKAKPLETPLEYKKKLVLDQEKSKHSLAQIYEKEYMEQQAALDQENADEGEEEPELHKEVKKMAESLFRKLDALSNFHFTPKPAIPELRVINNLPAINMEEVSPLTSSNAALLAPEEIRNKPKGDILGKSEKTATDKRRERRKKKIKQKHHVQQINKNLLTSNKKQKDKSMSKGAMRGRNVEMMDEKLNSKSVKSSTAFFQQLQEKVQSHIGERKEIKKNKEKIILDAKKLKL